MLKLAAAVWGRVVNGNGPPSTPMNRRQPLRDVNNLPCRRTKAGSHLSFAGHPLRVTRGHPLPLGRA